MSRRLPGRLTFDDENAVIRHQKRDDEPTQVQAYFDSENASKFDMGLHVNSR
jgi:hypothetical protein